jgi:hypothetical protein
MSLNVVDMGQVQCGSTIRHMRPHMSLFLMPREPWYIVYYTVHLSNCWPWNSPEVEEFPELSIFPASSVPTARECSALASRIHDSTSARTQRTKGLQETATSLESEISWHHNGLMCALYAAWRFHQPSHHHGGKGVVPPVPRHVLEVMIARR